MIKENDYVIIEYTGSFEDGEVFDSNVNGDPFEFQVGSNMIIPGLEKSVMGLKVGDEKEVVIEPDDAYGAYNDEYISSFPIDDIKASFEPELGMTIGVQMDNGHQIPAIITEITDTEVIVDMNHPLAGKTIHFKVKVLEINDEPQLPVEGCGCGEEHGHDHEHGGGDCGCSN